MAQEPGVHALQAAPLQVGIESLEALEGWDGHQEIAARVSYQAFHLALVVVLAGAPGTVVEPVVGLDLRERSGALAAAVGEYLGHRQPGIVVQDALRHGAQEGEIRNMAVQEGLGGLHRIGLDEAAIAVGRVQDKAVSLALHAR